MTNELVYIKGVLLEASGMRISNVQEEKEAKDYYGCTFQLGSFHIKYRKAKITPKKLGQFVALWKRNAIGKTEPYHRDDNFDFYVIETEYENRRGWFLFPKVALSLRRILTSGELEVKRGFRVYPLWDVPTSKQAIATKKWQIECFIDLANDSPLTISKLSALLSSR